MIIDIIDLTDEEMAKLSIQQMLILRSGQKRKNELTEELEKDMRSAMLLLLANNMFRSTVRDEMIAELEAEYAKKVEELREQVTFGIANSSTLPAASVSYRSVPYEVNENYSMVQRVQVVQDYYLSIEDPAERMQLYAEDEVAKEYLGEYYVTLYSILEQYS
ncbi:MAG: hypothetical protein J6D37_08465 [Clostridia bacterium]|nr:hypothetical protein [Clostridia bacterium]